ncbi:major facilitator superfamily domain-containing protein [Fusarium redolens]|uniref:Major facilitator superfamily domain-containing protein n=1 Tax=Fusarium redolens TaxID=48865 RepID=A0A9P9G1L9_FUSRE|nr:major facilitator superfamily domain-containing protein [Fusarium redolens]KAH7227210.1 major facilitator superfamily domain-containing protein [Fusarium redolens]
MSDGRLIKAPVDLTIYQTITLAMAPSPSGDEWLDATFELPDNKNPLKFSRRKQAQVVAAGIAIIANSALGSSLPYQSPAASPAQLPLYAWICDWPPDIRPSQRTSRAPPVLIGTYLSYMIFTLCCAVSPNFTALLIFRLFCGVTAAAPNAVVGPVFADIFDHPGPRGKATAYYMCATAMVPPLGPIISGYATRHSWRLTFWVGLGISGVFLPLVFCLPETYSPIIRKKHFVDPEAAEKQQLSLAQELKIIFSRPFVMAAREPVVLFTSLYLALVYATLYLFFQAYPIIFQGVYQLSSSEVGLTYLPITAGSIVALGLFLGYSSYHSSAMKVGAAWANKIEYRRLPLACAGGPLIVASLFWLGWTSYSEIHAAVPSMSGLLFGAGYLMEFMALLNYITDAYRQYSASAQAASSTIRSITAVVLPLAAPPMYENLGIQWACSLLAFFTLVLTCIPFVFIKYGETLRTRSPFCQKLSTAAGPVVSA